MYIQAAISLQSRMCVCVCVCVAYVCVNNYSKKRRAHEFEREGNGRRWKEGDDNVI